MFSSHLSTKSMKRKEQSRLKGKYPTEVKILTWRWRYMKSQKIYEVDRIQENTCKPNFAEIHPTHLGSEQRFRPITTKRMNVWYNDERQCHFHMKNVFFVFHFTEFNRQNSFPTENNAACLFTSSQRRGVSQGHCLPPLHIPQPWRASVRGHVWLRSMNYC